MNKCKRGQIWLVDFDPSRGSEQAGTRPALIVQNDIGNKYADTTIIVAISSNLSEYPQNVILEKTDKNGLTKTSCIKCGQILTITQNRLIKQIGEISKENLIEVDRALELSLGMI